MKGIIALDIDGTITAHAEQLPKNVLLYLTSLAAEGWSLFFITGRPFKWGARTLKDLSFPYYFGIQNGAIILEMPSRKIKGKKYLPNSILPVMESICRGEPSDFVIYSGFENQDLCYYRPKNFSSSLLLYLQNRKQFLKEEWVPLESFEELKLQEFPSIKCFGKFEDVDRVRKQIEGELNLHVPLVRDPFDPTFYVLQGTDQMVDKGQALKELIVSTGCTQAVIAAGDDLNDCTLFQAADVKIAMATAPKELLERADIIAPPASEEGIIKGLQQAIEKVRAM